MSRFFVGLTGGIGSGKTTVSDMFQIQHQIDVVDADVISREVVAPGSKGLKEITERFGPGILDEEGALNRASLRGIIFKQPEEKTWLNNLLHPMIRNEMIRQCQEAKSAYVILSIPLLVENKLQSLAHRILVVDCSEQAQLARSARRDGVGEEQIKSIMQSQASREERLEAADDVILNEVPLEELQFEVTRLHQKYRALAQASPKLQ